LLLPYFSPLKNGKREAGMADIPASSFN